MSCYQVRERPMKISDLKKKKGDGMEREKARWGHGGWGEGAVR